MKIIALSLLLAVTQQTDSCTPHDEGDVKTVEPVIKVESGKPRIEVSIIGKFPDPMAYNGRRGIYIIRDTETGREFFGVSGVGISELGSHNAGKTSVSDER